jgi:hypothetical protein
MGEKNEIPELRVRRVGEIFDAAVKVWGSNLRRLASLTFWIVLPFQVVGSLLAVSVKPSLTDTYATWNKTVLDPWQKKVSANPNAQWNPPPLPKLSSAQIGAFSATRIIDILASVILTAVLTAVIGHLILRDGRAISVKQGLRTVTKRGLALLAASILGLAIIVSPLAFIFLAKSASLAVLIFPLTIVSLWLFIRFFVAGSTIVLEGCGPVAALRRSYALTKRRWWGVFRTVIVTYAIQLIPQAILAGLIRLLLNTLGGNNGAFEFVWAALAGTVAAAVFAPLTASIAVFLYFDLRVRKEGFDLDRLAADFSADFSRP